MSKCVLLRGHLIRNEVGRRILVTQRLIDMLAARGLFEGRRDRGLLRIRRGLSALLESDGYRDEIVRELGRAQEGPEWTDCDCADCRRLFDPLIKAKAKRRVVKTWGQRRKKAS